MVAAASATAAVAVSEGNRRICADELLKNKTNNFIKVAHTVYMKKHKNETLDESVVSANELTGAVQHICTDEELLKKFWKEFNKDK